MERYNVDVMICIGDVANIYTHKNVKYDFSLSFVNITNEDGNVEYYNLRYVVKVVPTLIKLWQRLGGFYGKDW